jgi:hypothetical protein
MSIETIYLFNSDESARSYIADILTKFTAFMSENNYDTLYPLSIYELFTILNTTDEICFNTIPEAFAFFRVLALYFCSVGRDGII